MRQLDPAEIEKWLRGLGEMDRHNEVLGLAMASVFGIPSSFLDVGSGTGALASVFFRLGIMTRGVDILPTRGLPYLVQHDLEEPLRFHSPFGMVACIETAEHIRPGAADILCDSLAFNLADRGLLIFTAAMPGQQGDGHVNCQPAEYWRTKLSARGLHYRADLTYRLALAWSIANQPLHWVEANLQVFTK